MRDTTEMTKVGPPRVSWSRVSGFHATGVTVSNSIGVRQRCRLSSSTCMRDQKASIMALS